MGCADRDGRYPGDPLSSTPRLGHAGAAPRERPLLSFSRKTLDEGPRVVKAALPAAWLAAQLADDDGAEGPEEGASVLTASEDGAIDARLTPTGGDAFLLQGHVRARVAATCARCLGPAIVPVDAGVTLLLVPDEKAPRAATKRSKESDGEPEFDADEADVATYDGETVILDPLVREAILLELPISPLCDEGCPGMASPPSTGGSTASSDARPGTDDLRHAAFRQKLAALRDQLPAAPSESKAGGPGKKK